MAATGLGFPAYQPGRRREAGLRDSPDPRAAARGLSKSGHSPLEGRPIGDLTMRDRSMSRHAALYAVVVLCLSIAITPCCFSRFSFFDP